MSHFHIYEPQANAATFGKNILKGARDNRNLSWDAYKLTLILTF